MFTSTSYAYRFDNPYLKEFLEAVNSPFDQTYFQARRAWNLFIVMQIISCYVWIQRLILKRVLNLLRKSKKVPMLLFSLVLRMS